MYALLSTTSLKLAYDFSPKPNPILASAPGHDAERIDLQIVVSNPLRTAVDISKITIEIPLGQEVSRDLSNNTALPSPVYDTTGPWAISTEAGTVTIVPRDGDSGQVTAPIIFTLPGIVVNQTAGAVPLIVSEIPPPPGSKVSDSITYKLQKQPANFPVVNFRAEPATVTDLQQPVTLRWDTPGKINGVDPVFGLQANRGSTPFKSCVESGDCYTPRGGIDGVVVSQVNETTTFTLTVVTTSAAGQRTVVGTLTTTVQVTVPWIAPTSNITSKFSGRVFELHWLAFNAKYCTVEIDGDVIDSNAPTDTYRGGYVCVAPTDADGKRSVTVKAYALTGNAQVFLTFPDQRARPMTKIGTLDHPARSIATFTRSSAGAAVVSAADGATASTISLVNLAGRRWMDTPISVNGFARKVAFTPNGGIGLVTRTGIAEPNNTVASLNVVSIDELRVWEDGFPMPASLWSVAMSQDARTALVTSQTASVTLVDIRAYRVEGTLAVSAAAAGVAISPAGDLAFVTHPDAGSVSVINLRTRVVEPTTINVGGHPSDIAVTPDGTLALVVSSKDNTVTVIDVARRTVDARVIHTGGEPRAIAIAPDGSVALTADYAGSVTVIDIARRASITLPWQGKPTAVGISPDSSTALVAADQADGKSVVMEL